MCRVAHLKFNLFVKFVFFITLTLSNIISSIQGHGGHDDGGDGSNSSNSSDKGKLLVISLDGFRHDFLELYKTETLSKLGSDGVRAKSLTSAYITKTFPNHHSIATGLYEESHGIVGNSMWDQEFQENFNDCSSKVCGKWYGGEPIWNSNELNNHHSRSPNNIYKGAADKKVQQTRRRRHGGTVHRQSKSSDFASGVIYWPGSTAEINNMNITFIEGYVSSTDPKHMKFPERLDKMLSWFTDSSTPINLGMIYYEYPDAACHKFGPESDEVGEIVREIDGQIKDFLEKLKAHGLTDLNIMIVSDHGFADVSGYLFLEDCIDSSKYNITKNNPIISIWPYNEEDAEAIYTNLTKCEGYIVHWKNSTELREYHYSSNRRISPIIVSTPKSKDGKSAKLIKQHKSENWTISGQHGWNSSWEQMHGIFIANGPAFKRGHIHEKFENVNIYPLMCKVLGITCPATNGSLSVVSDMLKESSSTITLITVVCAALTCAFIAGVMVIGVCRLGGTSTKRNGTINSRSYSLRVSGKSTAERSTLLETSDDEF